MDLLKPLIKGSTDTLLRTARANELRDRLAALSAMKVIVGGAGGSRFDVTGEKSLLTIGTSDLLAALPTGAGHQVTVSTNPPPAGTGSTGDVWIQTGTANISQVSAVFLKFEGSLILNQIFGYFSPAEAVTITDAQIAVQTEPTGADVILTLVDGSGTSLGVTLTLPAGTAGVALQPNLAVAAAGVVRVKITQIGSTAPGGYLSLTLGYHF